MDLDDADVSPPYPIKTTFRPSNPAKIARENLDVARVILEKRLECEDVKEEEKVSLQK